MSKLNSFVDCPYCKPNETGWRTVLSNCSLCRDKRKINFKTLNDIFPNEIPERDSPDGKIIEFILKSSRSLETGRKACNLWFEIKKANERISIPFIVTNPGIKFSWINERHRMEMAICSPLRVEFYYKDKIGGTYQAIAEHLPSYFLPLLPLFDKVN